MDISLPSTRASTLFDELRSGICDTYRTPNVDTVECDQAAGVGLPPMAGVGASMTSWGVLFK